MKTILLILMLIADSAKAQSTIQLTWIPSLSSLLISNITYTVWQGNASGNYTTSYSAGSNASLTVTNLTHNQTYYFSVTASGNGLTSSYAQEATFTLVQPIAPTGLRVSIITP